MASFTQATFLTANILSAENYGAFKEALLESQCNKCALSQSRTQIVVDRGNPEARVLMIGEAPGQNEDLEGKAFVGRSGRLLDQLLKDIGFDTSRDSLIVNVVKCRPPDNRAPHPREVGECFPFLKKQIDLVNPRTILLLGAVALRHVIPDREFFSMERETGRFFEDPHYPGVQFIVLYHPAYILRDPRKKPIMMEHLKVFRDYWKQA